MPVDGADSEHVESTAVVPQGSVVGPLLYAIYYFDVPENDETMINVFADDTGLLCSSSNPCSVFRFIQHHLNELQEYFCKWKSKVNPSKHWQSFFHDKDHRINFQC